MEMMVLQTISAAAMALIGALIARGWPEGGGRSRAPEGRAPGGCGEDDVFARDLAAMMEYSADRQEEADEA